jgi:ADP-ribose pyrophosphatase YjhB (NUDIX family)
MSYIQWIRGRTGRRKIFLVFASVVLYDRDGRTLLQRRTDFDWWGIPGGALELDEDILACARRELVEETGLTAGDLRLTGIYTDPRYEVVYPNGDQVQQFTICFSGRLAGGAMAVEAAEVKELRFFETAGLPWDNIPLWYADMLRDALKGGEPAFLPPYTAPQTIDQIGDIRPLIGPDWYIGVGATAVIQREDGRLLLIQRSEDGYWAFPAGFSDLGENVAHTAVRETLEETGLHIRPERILGIFSGPAFHYTYPNGDRVKNVSVIFLARPLGGTAQASSEITSLEWLTPAEILARQQGQPFEPLFQAIIHQLSGGYFVM